MYTKKFLYKNQYEASFNSNSSSLELQLEKILLRIPKGEIVFNNTTVKYDTIDESILKEIYSLLKEGVDLTKLLPNKNYSILQNLISKNNALALYYLLILSGYNSRDINYQYQDKITLLMIACILNNITIVQILLFNNICDVNLLNNHQQTALDIVTNPTLKQLLIKYGAKTSEELKTIIVTQPKPQVVTQPKYNTCSICLENKDYTIENGPSRIAVVNPCNHTFHFGCITNAKKHNNLCPLCKRDMINVNILYN